jgi:hypothetical protein
MSFYPQLGRYGILNTLVFEHFAASQLLLFKAFYLLPTILY